MPTRSDHTICRKNSSRVHLCLTHNDDGTVKHAVLCHSHALGQNMTVILPAIGQLAERLPQLLTGKYYPPKFWVPLIDEEAPQTGWYPGLFVKLDKAHAGVHFETTTEHVESGLCARAEFYLTGDEAQTLADLLADAVIPENHVETPTCWF